MKRKLISVIVAVMTLLQCVSVMAYTETEAINALEFTELSFETQDSVTRDLFFITNFHFLY